MMARLGKVWFLAAAALSAPLRVGAETNLDFIHAIPDLTQSQIRGLQHNNGSEYCAPVAVANSLAWLANQPESPARLAIQLASRAYMNTDILQGTTTANLLRGVHGIAIELFGGYTSLQYQGWKKHPPAFGTGIGIPALQWIRAGVASDSAVWLNVGWYQYDWRRNIYHRVGGHWVTVAGYDDTVLIIHDPAPRAGHEFANEFVQTVMIDGGVLADPVTGMFRPASGYLRLAEGMHIKPIADVAIIDGAVRFRK